MKQKQKTLSIGLALFAMFFGSGNLVFPLMVGLESGGHFWLAAFGILLTGVAVPFLGSIGMLLYEGDTRGFFDCLGKWAAFWVPLVAVSLMGPFGVLARCITVAYGSIHLLFPVLPLWLFSVLFCIGIFFATVKRSRLIPLLGKFLTPLLLLSLGAITLFAFVFGGTAAEASGDGTAAFVNGIFQGYQTMDLIAAFFFSTFVIGQIRKESDDKEDKGTSLRMFLQASMVGAGLLSLVYVLLVSLGNLYAPALATVPKEEMLGVVASLALGPYAAPVVAVAVMLACFTTAVVLSTLFADFFQKEVVREKVSSNMAMGVTLLIGFLVSTMGFYGIAKILGPILETLYPALILLTIQNIGKKLWGWRVARWPFATLLVVTLLFSQKILILGPQ